MKRNAAIWNGLMVERAAEYFDVAFFRPARRHFPKLRGSNWCVVGRGHVTLGSTLDTNHSKSFDRYYKKWTPDYCIPGDYSDMPCLAVANGSVGHGAVVCRGTLAEPYMTLNNQSPVPSMPSMPSKTKHDRSAETRSASPSPRSTTSKPRASATRWPGLVLSQ